MLYHMTEIVISGALGRMGRAVLEAAGQDPEIQIAALVEAHGHPELGSFVDVRGRKMALTCCLPEKGKGVVVDFSSPAGAAERAEAGAAQGRPLVIGTTGLDPEQQGRIEKAARKVAVVQAANFSTGIAVLGSLVRRASGVLKNEADVEIIEIHHNRKKDAPSGTALALGKAAGFPPDAHVFGRHGTAERKPGVAEVGVHAVRAGDVAGDHTVLFGLAGERLELTHRAHGRENFARGALRAAKFAVQAKPGLYGMEQVLGIE